VLLSAPRVAATRVLRRRCCRTAPVCGLVSAPRVVSRTLAVGVLSCVTMWMATALTVDGSLHLPAACDGAIVGSRRLASRLGAQQSSRVLSTVRCLLLSCICAARTSVARRDSGGVPGCARRHIGPSTSSAVACAAVACTGRLCIGHVWGSSTPHRWRPRGCVGAQPRIVRTKHRARGVSCSQAAPWLLRPAVT
jgi:hypothetical protein